MDQERALIRERIETSRRELSETVGQLEQRLDMKSRIRTSAPLTGKGAFEWAKAHPGKAAMVATAALWLIRAIRR